MDDNVFRPAWDVKKHEESAPKEPKVTALKCPCGNVAFFNAVTVHRVEQDGHTSFVFGNQRPVCTGCGKLRTVEELIDAGTIIDTSGVKKSEGNPN